MSSASSGKSQEQEYPKGGRFSYEERRFPTELNLNEANTVHRVSKNVILASGRRLDWT